MSAKEIAHLAERWLTMTAREKDAWVAKARGWTAVRLSRDERFAFGFPPGFDGDRQLVPQVPRFDEWPQAGMLLEELRDLDGSYVKLVATDTGWAVECRNHRVEADDAPDAIALAYCLAKGAA